jgi:hypothetical protein
MRFRLVVMVALSPLALSAQDPGARAGRLGTVRFESSCTAAAQPAFIRGVTQLHSFVFGGATQSFQDALKADPACAIAYWGIALTTWGNPFAPGLKSAAQLARGLETVQAGRAAGAKTERERDYVAAAAKLYENHQTVDQMARLIAYRDAMRALAAKYPSDTEATIFYALSIAIANDPTDKTYAGLLESGAMLERLVAAQPDHPGLAHYIIHSYDVPPLADRALARRAQLREIAPAAPHALHMPSHTFTRVGSWQESIDANRASAVSPRPRARSPRSCTPPTTWPTHTCRWARTAPSSSCSRAAGTGASLRRRARLRGRAALGRSLRAGRGPRALRARARPVGRNATRLEARTSGVPYADAVTHFARAIGRRAGRATGGRAQRDHGARAAARRARARARGVLDRTGGDQRRGGEGVARVRGRPPRRSGRPRCGRRPSGRTRPRRPRSRPVRSLRRASCSARCCSR